MALRYVSRAVNTPAALRLLASGPRVAPSSSAPLWAPLRPLASRCSQVGPGHNNDVPDEAATKATTTTTKKKKTCRTSTGKQQATEKAVGRKMKKIDRSLTGNEQVIQRETVGAAHWLLARRKTIWRETMNRPQGKEEVEEASEMETEKTRIAGEEILEVDSNDKPEKKTDGLSFMVEEQVTGKEIVQVARETTESETDGSDSDVGEEEELMTDEEFERVFAEVNELLAYTTRDAIYDRFSLDREFLMVRLSKKKPFVQAMYFYVRDLLLEELESRRRRERDDGGADLTDDAHGDNGD